MNFRIMPLQSPDLSHLRAAEGFLAPGMYEEANAELEKIDPFCRGVRRQRPNP
jgi:hypothetical protein